MEIETRGRKIILPTATVFDLDRNAAVWSFVFPESVAHRETATLSGWLAIKTNARDEAVRIPAEREGVRFTVSLPAGLFKDATVAEVQFSLQAGDFAWYSEIETVNVVRCLNPLGEAEDYEPEILLELENAVLRTEEKVNALLAGTTPAGRAEKDGEGNVIALTYATKNALESLQSESEKAYATKEEVNGITDGLSKTYATKEEVAGVTDGLSQTYATKEEVNGITNGLSKTYVTKEELAGAQAENQTAFATKQQVREGLDAITGGATEYTDFSKVEAVLTDTESGNAALSEKCRVLEKNSTWFVIDYTAVCQEAEGTGEIPTELLHRRIAEIKEKFHGLNRPNVMLYASGENTPFYYGSAFTFVSGVNYYYYTYGKQTDSCMIKLNGCSNINLHGFVLTGVDPLVSALQMINCTNIRVERCALINKKLGSVFLNGCKDILLEDCALYGGGSSNMEVTVRDTTNNTTSITFRHCRFQNNGGMAVNGSEVQNPNLSLVLDHVYYSDGKKVSAKDCAMGKARVFVTALEGDLPTCATDEADGLMSKEQFALLSQIKNFPRRCYFAVGEVGVYDEYPVTAQVQYVRTGIKCGFLTLVYRMPAIPAEEHRFGHISQAKLNDLMHRHFAMRFAWETGLSGFWIAGAEQESKIPVACGVGTYAGYIEPFILTESNNTVGLALKDSSGALFRLVNIFVIEE